MISKTKCGNVIQFPFGVLRIFQDACCGNLSDVKRSYEGIFRWKLLLKSQHCKKSELPIMYESNAWKWLQSLSLSNYMKQREQGL